MSGFEVVGVVLGALPLIITAVDQYRVSKRLFHVFRYKEPYIDRLIQSLKEQKFFIESDLHMTLKETFIDQEFVQTTSVIFDDPEVAQAVEEYLSDGYQHYIVALSRCEQILAEIAGNIGGLASNQQNLSGLVKANPPRNGSYELTKKIKFSLDKDDLEKRIKDLNDATLLLRRIRDYSLPRAGVTLQSGSSAAAKITSSFDSIREHAHRLYTAISTAYRGSCHAEHEAHLLLQSRADLMERKRAKLKKPPVSFTISFGPVGDATSCHPNHTTEVKVLEEELLTSQSIQIGPFHDAPQTSYGFSEQISLISHQRGFQTERQRESTITINLPNPSPPTSTATPSIIQNLCQHLSDETDLRALLLSKKCHLMNHQTPETIISPRLRTAMRTTIVSLDQVLQPTSTMKPLLNSRIALSLNIASSVMQLNFTQWFHLPLTSNNIRLYHADSHKPGLGIRPFISQKFTPSPQPLRNGTVRRTMLELGIILLELWHAKTFAVYAADVDMFLDGSFGTRYDVARSWLDISRDDILPFYSDVITRCIECNFATSTADLDWNDTAFRKSVYDYVVKPLWENCPAGLR